MQWLATSAIVVACTWLGPTLALAYTFGDWASDHGYYPGAVMPAAVYVNNASIDSLEGIGDYDWTTAPTTFLALSSNQLSRIEPGAFSGLTNLEVLYLIDNQLSCIDLGTFDGLTNLRILSLNNNQLTNLVPDSFVGLMNLSHLSLDNNQLATIEASTFDGLTHLGVLDLHNNRLTTIEAGAFHWARYLFRLDLYDNPALTEMNLAYADLSNLGFGFQLFDVGNNVSISRVSLKGAVIVQESLMTLIDGGVVCGLGQCEWGVGIGKLPGVTELDLSHVDFANVNDLTPFYTLDHLTDLWLVGTKNIDAFDLDAMLEELDTFQATDVEGVLYMTPADYATYNAAGGGLLERWNAEPGHHVEFVIIPEPTFLGLLLAGTAVVGFLRTWKM